MGFCEIFSPVNVIDGNQDLSLNHWVILLLFPVGRASGFALEILSRVVF